MIVIRLWTQADIDFVTESVQRERWGYTRRDVERCWQYEPKGCFIAELNHEPIGHVFSVSYGKIGWIGLLIVKEKQRNKGVGTLLTQKAIEYLRKIGVETIRLEAAEKAVPLYKRLGFIEEFDSLRFSKTLKPRESLKLNGQKMIVNKIEERNLEAIAKFDSKYFGANRLRVLQSLYKDQPQQAFIAKENHKILGYIIDRKILNAHWIGPWVSDNSETAEKLLCACIEAIRAKEETEIHLGMPILNKNGIKLMKKLGFKLTSKSIRMVWGKRKHKGDAIGLYGIAGPEKG